MFQFFRKPPPPTTQFTDQETVVGILQNDPRIMSHIWGREIYRLQRIERDDEQAQARIDQVLSDIGRQYADDPATVSRILGTMIRVYDVEISTQTGSWARIHNRIADYVSHNHDQIEVYR